MLLDVGTPQRIALIKPSALGDVVQALPVLSALRRRFPAARITWIVNRSYASLLAGHPDLDDVIGFNRGLLKESLSDGLQDILAFLRRVRQSRFDLTIDLQGLFRTGL